LPALWQFYGSCGCRRGHRGTRDRPTFPLRQEHDEWVLLLAPATAEAFEQANIYARASGDISKRNLDIGSRVKAGDLLVEIIAPELEHQITQAEGIVAQLKASLVQARANRDLAQVTWDRDNSLVQNGWATALQGDTDRLNLQARAAAVTMA
jgi:multidrug efflux pump subunit AcrA (membrane-fusion protein)